MYRVLSKAKCNITPMMTDQGQRQDSTGGKGRQKEGIKAGKEAAVVHTGGKDIRSGETKGRREGGKKEKGADEAGKPAQSYRIFKFYSRCTFLVIVRLVHRC